MDRDTVTARSLGFRDKLFEWCPRNTLSLDTYNHILTDVASLQGEAFTDTTAHYFAHSEH